MARERSRYTPEFKDEADAISNAASGALFDCRSRCSIGLRASRVLARAYCRNLKTKQGEPFGRIRRYRGPGHTEFLGAPQA
jgi:hypothetical protein